MSTAPGVVLLENAGVRVERAGARVTVTFLGARDTRTARKTCDEVVAMLHREAPASVVVACESASPGVAWGEAMKDQLLPSLRAFVFDTAFERPVFQRTNAIGDLGLVLDAAPNLTRFFATGALALAPTCHENLEAWTMVVDPAATDLADGLAASEFSRLEYLVLASATETEPCTFEPLLHAAKKMTAPRLTQVHVDLEDAEAAAPILGALARSWRRVSFGFAGPVDEDALAEALEEAPSGIEIGLPLGKRFSRAFAREAPAAFPMLRDNATWPWACPLPAAYAEW